MTDFHNLMHLTFTNDNGGLIPTTSKAIENLEKVLDGLRSGAIPFCSTVMPRGRLIQAGIDDSQYILVTPTKITVSHRDVNIQLDKQDTHRSFWTFSTKRVDKIEPLPLYLSLLLDEVVEDCK